MKAAKTPWTWEPTREGMAAVLGANGALVGVMSEVNARLVVEAVNERMRLEREVYSLPRAAYENARSDVLDTL